MQHKAEVWQRPDSMALFDANSSQAFQAIRVTPSPRVQGVLSDRQAVPAGSLRASGGLLEFPPEADCRMFEGVLDDAVGKVTPYLDALYEAYLEALCEEGGSMFARVVECQSKGGRSEQVGNKLKNNILPILQKQPGFVDFLTLSDKTNPERLVCISFWTSQEDAEEYHRHHYDTINAVDRAA